MHSTPGIVSEAYAGLGWRRPELLTRLQEADDLFFDAVSLVVLPAWSRGRIADRRNDHAAAFRRYETIHRARVTPKQRAIKLSAALLVPKTRFGLEVRNLGARLWPGGL
ncbi:hypothetical protein ORV05_24565 [Amycolatopsis cynarae]|uniref:Uncharacterized protein n=1 Tax=Amycolatopsis cynarae TaxID=2995223 RepID=A0ABY7AWP8_9PSEU|nr:hypothetical protein [Amycolatopsis sp. HUAS 11-8]WAL64139.1 hypothetical protein ORV05_24565 [Amycolatopsis sp. HUAS 11-8]